MAWGAVWRRSLQLRVVISTLALSTAVVLVLGFVIQTQIAGNILQAKLDDAQNQIESGAALLERELAERRPQPRGRAGRAQQRARPAHELLADASGTPAGGRVPRGARHHGDRGQLQRRGGPPRRRAVGPAAERRRRRPRACEYGTVDSQGIDVPALMIGQPVRTANGDLEFYLLFPLDSEQRTLGLVQSTLIVGGLVLLLLLAGHRQHHHAAGRAARCGAPRRSPSGSPTATSTSACPSRARTSWPGSASPTTRWRAASRSRSGSWRSSARCSGGSPPTSATSCAPR